MRPSLRSITFIWPRLVRPSSAHQRRGPDELNRCLSSALPRRDARALDDGPPELELRFHEARAFFGRFAGDDVRAAAAEPLDDTRLAQCLHERSVDRADHA